MHGTEFGWGVAGIWWFPKNYVYRALFGGSLGAHRALTEHSLGAHWLLTGRSLAAHLALVGRWCQPQPLGQKKSRAAKLVEELS